MKWADESGFAKRRNYYTVPNITIILYKLILEDFFFVEMILNIKEI